MARRRSTTRCRRRWMAFQPIPHRPQLIFGFSDAPRHLQFSRRVARDHAGRKRWGVALPGALGALSDSWRAFCAPCATPPRGPAAWLTSVAPGMSMQSLFHRVLQDFRTSYVLTYMLRGVKPAGGHQLTVTVTVVATTSGRGRGMRAGKAALHRPEPLSTPPAHYKALASPVVRRSLRLRGVVPCRTIVVLCKSV